MTMQDTTARMVLAAAMRRSEDSLPPSPELGDTEGWDSIAHVNLVLDLEAHLSRSLTPIEMLQINTLAGIAALLEREG